MSCQHSLCADDKVGKGREKEGKELWVESRGRTRLKQDYFVSVTVEDEIEFDAFPKA